LINAHWFIGVTRADRQRGQLVRNSFVSLLLVRCPTREGGEEEMAMSRTTGDGRAVVSTVAATQNDELIARAAKRTVWAGAALESAAGDLHGAHDHDGKALTGIAEVVLDEATRVHRLSEDIESQRPTQGSAADSATGLVEGGVPRWRR
jgi:hypothetical protein